MSNSARTSGTFVSSMVARLQCVKKYWRILIGFLCQFWARLVTCLLAGTSGVLVLGVVVVGVILLIKTSMWLLLSPSKLSLIAATMPLLKELVWPVFFLILVFLFREKLEEVLGRIPGLVDRISFPLWSGTPTDTRLSGMVVKDADKVVHEKRIRSIFQLIQQEYGVEISENIKILQSKFVCDGAFMAGRTPCYIIVIPRVPTDQLESIIQRVNNTISFGAALKKQSSAGTILMCCIYGFDNMAQIKKEVNVERLREIARYKLLFRFFTKMQLSDGVGEE